MEILYVGIPRRLGYDQLCWNNFRIIGTGLSGISIEHNSRIIGSRYVLEGVVRVWSGCGLFYTAWSDKMSEPSDRDPARL